MPTTPRNTLARDLACVAHPSEAAKREKRRIARLTRDPKRVVNEADAIQIMEPWKATTFRTKRGQGVIRSISPKHSRDRQYLVGHLLAVLAKRGRK